MSQRYLVANMNAVSPVECPCGQARRAFLDDVDQLASLHVVESDGNAKLHYHKRMTEVYYVLEGQGQMQLDGDLVDIGPGSSILIKPGCRHRAIGKLKYINVPIPAFDAEDEWFD